MAGYNAGSVSARIELDTSHFKEELEALKSSIKTLKQEFNNVSLQSVAKDVEKLKKQMKGLSTETKNSSKNLKNQAQDINKYNKAITEVSEATKLWRKEYDYFAKNTYNGKNIVDSFKKINSEITKTTQSTQKSVNTEKEFENTLIRLSKAIKLTNQSLSKQKYEYAQLENELTKYLLKTELVAKINSQNKGTRYDVSYSRRNGYYDAYSLNNLKNAGEMFKSISRLARSSDLEFRRAFSNMTVASQQFFSKTDLGVSNYKKRIEEISQTLRKSYLEHERYYASVAMSTKYWNTVRNSNVGGRNSNAYYKGQTVGMSQYYGNINKINEAIAKQTARTERLKKAQMDLWKKYHTTNLNTYKANMGQINAELEKQLSNTKKTTTATKNMGRGLTSFNNGVVQTAHSGRILSNTLYQIRGALLSLKMIFTAMGGMALWGFASNIAEGVKETVTAKNEMEAQLNQIFTDKNGYVDTSGIQYFRKELDKLPKTFKKVNKYQVGETATSIGLEFDLSAKQMADALPIITMVSSEYVRAGRKESEAALAVKDILQGEFQRLSRETGVGKEELKAYGWNGKTDDVNSILKAVKKAGLDRHWDVFAKKATSLNDVLTITKSRFSELGADVVDSVTPSIVGGFNTIIDTIDNLQKSFNGLSSFWQNVVFMGGGTGLIGLAGTVLPMVTKGMGLAEISTLGWGKSLATAALNLNKAEVGQYGFRKALAATITGTKASEIATMRSSKAIFGRLLGVNQSVLAENGLMTALVHSKASLKGQAEGANYASMATGSLRQKIIYLTKGEIVADKASASWGKTIKSLITSTKLWRLAIMGVTSVGLIAWLSSVAMWTDSVKKRFETYNTILSEGKDKIKDAQDDIDTYQEKLNNMNTSNPNYNLTKANLETAKHNKEDLEQSLKLAKELKKTNKETTKSNDLKLGRGLEQIYSANGVKNVEKYGKNYRQMKQVAYDMQKAEEERYKFQYASLQHITEHTKQMEKAKVSEKDRVKYATEYYTKAEEAAEHLKQFNEGDFMAGMYYVMDRISLLWIDLWNDQHFIKFWDSVNRTWKDLQPTVRQLVDDFFELGHILLDFLSTKQGQIIGGIALMGVTFAGVGLKLKGVYDKLKPLGGSLKNLAKRWRKVGDEAKEASDKMGGSTSTGGVTGNAPTTTSTGGVKSGEFWKTVGQDAKNTGRTMFKYGGYIAAAMFLVSETIILLNVPMLALAATGVIFHSVEPQVKQGIEGLKLIAPTVLAIMTPMIAVMYILDKFKVSTAQITEGFKSTAIGVALAITLVTEAIVLLTAPLLGLAILGQVYNGIKDSVQQGVKAIQATTDALKTLVPWIPVFIGGIALGAMMVAAPEIGFPALLAVVAGIATGIAVVTEAVLLLTVPLEAVKEIGEKYTDLTGVEQGAKALKLTAEALGYVQEAMTAMTLVKWDLLASAVADLIGVKIGVDLNQLSGEGGLFDQLKTFTEDFNKLEITPINQDKVTTLSDSATGLASVKTALTTVKDALKDLPNFEVDNRSPNEKYNDAVSGNTTSGITNYFEQLKQPVEQLNEFIKNFNDNITVEALDTDKVTTLQQSASFITTIKSAIDEVKTAVGAGIDAQWNSNVQTSGILGAGFGLLFGNAGQSSSIKGALDELEACVTDIMNFNSNIQGITGSANNDTSGISNATSMTSALSTEINNLKTALSGAIPTVKGVAKNMGSAIVSGFKDGVKDLSTSAKTTGETLGTKISDGFKDKFKIKTIAQDEISATLTAIGGNDNVQEFYDKGKALGDAFQRGYKDGGGIASPGYAARAAEGEIGYIKQYIQEGINDLPAMAFNLGSALSNNFNFDLGLSNIQLPDVSSFTSGLQVIPDTVSGIQTDVSTQFNNMNTNIGGAFSGILSNTRSNMSNMLSMTTKNIGAIRTSWKGMQTALINSAENIRQQTGSKINNLKTNLGDFWKKIQNPSLLLGSAGGHQGTIRRRYGGSSMMRGLFAGGTSNSNSPNIKTDLEKYLECMASTNGNCYAGGWSFNWNKPIQSKFNGWNTHFGKYKIDDYVKVGKFYNNSFPVKGIAEIAKAYIFDTISATNYSKYFNSNFGDDPLAALAAGAFNCWDGTNIVLALASAFGFSGSREHGTWNGIGHVWANIPGLGIIDPTAIQQNGSFKSSAVKGYSAGGTTTRNSSSKGDLPSSNGDTYNTNIEIHVHGDDVEVNNRKIDRRSGKQILDILGINPATGR